MRRTAVALLAAVTLALAGCSGGGDADPGPTATRTVTATPTPSVDAAAARAACVDAWAVVIGSRSDDFDPETDEDVEPVECQGLSGESTDMYMEGLSKANQKGIDELRQQIEDAASADAQP